MIETKVLTEKVVSMLRVSRLRESLKYPLDTKFDQMKQSLVEQKNAFPIDKRQIVTREFSN